jgi:hypothetical protein
MDLQTSVAEFLKISGVGFAGVLFLISLAGLSLPKRRLLALSASPYVQQRHVQQPISGNKSLVNTSASR